MNILYLNHYAGSPAYGMEYRPFYLAREWVRGGHRVRMVGASHSHVRTVQPAPPLRSAARWVEMIEGIEYVWYRAPAYTGNGLGRVRNIATFLARVAADSKSIVREFRPDIVIASSTYPMDFWVARRIARLARARLIYEVHDLWPLSPIELGGMSPSHPFIRVCQAAEDSAYRDADAVVSMLPCVHEHMAAHGLDLRRLHIVPNGVSPDEWHADPQPLRDDVRQFIDSQRAAGRIVVGYAGSHGIPNALDVLLEAAAALRGEPLAFVLVGGGMEKDRLAARWASDNPSQVRMFDPIPKAQVPEFLRRIDVAYIGWRRSSIYRFGIAPNKLLDYMMAGCAVLHSVAAGNDPVLESGCGFAVEPESPSAVVDGLRRLAALPAAAREEMGSKGKEFVLRHHTYPVLAQRFLEACHP